MSDGKVIGLATTGIASGQSALTSARDHVKADEVRDLLLSAKARDEDPWPRRAALHSEAGENAHEFVPRADEVIVDSAAPAFKLRRRADAPPVGDELEALTVFRLAAQNLKHAEQAYRDAQQAYAEAVKALSEEAVK